MKVAEVINQMFTQKGSPGYFYLALIGFLKKCWGAKTISQLVDLTNLLCRA